MGHRLKVTLDLESAYGCACPDQPAVLHRENNGSTHVAVVTLRGCATGGIVRLPTRGAVP